MRRQEDKGGGLACAVSTSATEYHATSVMAEQGLWVRKMYKDMDPAVGMECKTRGNSVNPSLTSTGTKLVDRGGKTTTRPRNELVSIQSRDSYNVVRHGKGSGVKDQILWGLETVLFLTEAPGRLPYWACKQAELWFQHCSDLTRPFWFEPMVRKRIQCRD